VIVHVTANGQARAVEVTRSGGKFLISLDGRRQEVDVKIVDGVWSLLVGLPSASGEAASLGSSKLGMSEGGRSFEVAFSTPTHGAMTVHVDGIPVDVLVATAGHFGASPASHAAEGPQRVAAPMPGKIVKLLVKPGDKVQARQGLVVVEAMKMENEVRVLAAGTVSEVRVTEGSLVEAGAILVILE
jgi:biotin carboxyl carrier protein